MLVQIYQAVMHRQDVLVDTFTVDIGLSMRFVENNKKMKKKKREIN